MRLRARRRPPMVRLSALLGAGCTRRYADGYLLGRFGFDVQPYGHVHGLKRRLRDPCFQHALARCGYLAPRAHEPHICQRLAEHLLQHGEIVLMTMRHDKDVIALIKGQGGGDIVVIPHDRLLRAMGFVGICSKLLRMPTPQVSPTKCAREGWAARDATRPLPVRWPAPTPEPACS